MTLLFDLDLPVEQQRQHGSQSDDRAKNGQLRPFANDHGTQHLAAELKFEGKGDALRQLEPDVRIVPEIVHKTGHRGDEQHADARQLHQHDADLRDVMNHLLQNSNNNIHDPASFAFSLLYTMLRHFARTFFHGDAMELYIHLPFCKQKCRYCDFPSWPGCDGLMPRYVDALLLEAAELSKQYGHPAMETVFIGGGTPSLLPAPLMAKLLTGLRDHFDIPAGIEFTSEANPGTLTEDWLRVATEGGVNRLSLGMQSCQPALLKMLGRIHDFPQVADSVSLARQAGITNVNLDLMFGLPGQTAAMWRDTLDKALSLHPEHLSCYGLIPEDGTPLKADLDAGRLILPDEDDERRMYDDALTLLAEHGYKQYEISNFAKPGHECRHNLGYWRQVPYLGLGASALCFVTWNLAVRVLGAVKTAAYIYILPVITLITSALVLHEHITVMTVIGTVLALAGLVLSESKNLFRRKNKQ